MSYTKEEIERYLEILRSYNITFSASTNQAVGKLDVGIAKVIFLCAFRL